MDAVATELEKAISEYVAKHPNADNPMDALFSLGDEGLLDLLKEAGDREIIFEDSENPDDLKYSFR